VIGRPKGSRNKKTLEAEAVGEAPSGIQPEFIGPIDAETITGVSRSTWRHAAYEGRIESVKIGNRLLLPLSEVRRLIAEGTRPRKDGLPAGAPAPKRVRNSQAEAYV